jgi:ABC-type glycerol-3-phosphate transport system permease component
VGLRETPAALVFAYNEFIFALTFLGADTAKFTLPIYVQYFYGRNGAAWGVIMAASTLFTIPARGAGVGAAVGTRPAADHRG